MKRRSIVALSLVVVLAAALTAATSGATKKATANNITVWLQVDAQSGWPDVVAAANKQFQADHPGATVNVQYQNWGDHLQKFDATLAGGGGADVIEMGNTEMTKYMAAGAFADLTRQVDVRQLGELAEGPRGLGQVRRQDLRRPVLRGLARRHLPQRPLQEGRDQEAAGDARAVRRRREEAARAEPKKGFSPVYIAGTDWYVGMSFVFDYGGGIATQVSGKWKGLLNTPQSIAGLTAYKNFFNATSQASKTTDETHPNPYDVYAQGGAASMVGPSWFTLLRRREVQGHDRAVRDAGPRQGPVDSGLPRRLRPRRPGDEPEQGARRPTGSRTSPSTASEKALQAKGNIPNATNLLGTSVNERAAARSWFVPTAKHWVDVENGNILRNMLAQILSGKLSIKQAAASASDNIASVLNQS